MTMPPIPIASRLLRARGMVPLALAGYLSSLLLDQSLAQENRTRVWGINYEEGVRTTLIKQIGMGHKKLQVDIFQHADLDMQISEFFDLDVFFCELRAGRIHYGLMCPFVYAMHPDPPPLDPLLTPMVSKDGAETYSLLVSANSTVTNPRDRRPERVLFVINGNPNILQLWYASIASGKLNVTESNQMDAPKKAFYPVFYGQMDACIIPTHTFNVLKGLNPQIDKRVRELATSPCLPLAFIFANPNLPASERKPVQHATMAFAHGSSGRRVMSLTRLGDLKPFEPQHLHGFLDLRKKRALLPSEPAGISIQPAP